MKNQIAIIILFLIPIISFSQGKWSYFTKKDGLISNKIYASLADQKGNVWFISHKGISRFDGVHWFNYDNNEIKSKDKFHAFEDSKSNIWFWSHYYPKSLAMFDGNNFIFYKETGLKCKYISMITEDSKGQIWIMGHGGSKIDMFDGEKWHNFNITGDVRNLYKDEKGNIWVTSDVVVSYTVGLTKTIGVISKYNSDTLLAFEHKNRLPVNTGEGLPNSTIIFEDSNGNIWFNGYIGYTGNIGFNAISALLKYNGQDWTYYKDEVEGIIYRLEEDSKNIIWAFSSKGIYIFDGTKWKLLIGIRKINSFVEDNNGAIWIGMNFAIGKYENGKWKYFRPSDGFGGVNVIFKDSKGNIWFGGENVYLFKNNKWYMKNGKPGLIEFPDVSNIIEDKEGNIWISTKNGVVKYTE